MNGFAKASVLLLIYSISLSSLGPQTPCLGQESEKVLQASKADWKPLLGHWAICQFGGEGDVEIRGNRIVIASGQPLTGIYWNENHVPITSHGNKSADVGKAGTDRGKAVSKAIALIREGYELKLQARRMDGFDFFCGLTFPIADQHATLVLGGWGGGTTGLSCVDGLDASENDTNLFRDFENERWYRVRVRVDAKQVQCWVDDESIVQVSRSKHKFSLRTEMDLCEPLGIAAYECDAEFKDIMLRKLCEADQKTPHQEKANR